MNAKARQRSALIQAIDDLDGIFDCTYESQIDSPIGVILSAAFKRDIRRENAILLTMLDSETCTSEAFISFFNDDRELLEYLLTYYRCYQLRHDILPSLLQMKDRNRG